jgi:hypothetical protein
MKENTMKAVTIRAALAAALVSTLGLAGAAQAQSVVHVNGNSYGRMAPDDAADRTIVLKDNTRYVNVDDGETVHFVHGDQNFTWTFDTLQGDRVAALNKIAPQGFGDDNAEVYIAPNPIYNDY